MVEIDNFRAKERRETGLRAESMIIAIDGVDGSGKSTLAKMLVSKLNEGNRAVLVKFNLRGGGKGEERIRKIIEGKELSNKVTSGLIAAGINRTYGEQVIPALADGKIVVLDRSEGDLLRFAIEGNDQDLFERRLGYIQRGLLTHGFWAGNRVFVEMDPDDIWKNLVNRENKSKYDPHSLDEVKRRIQAQQKAEEILGGIYCEGFVNVIRVINEYHCNYREYLNSLASNIYDELMVSENRPWEK